MIDLRGLKVRVETREECENFLKWLEAKGLNG